MALWICLRLPSLQFRAWIPCIPSTHFIVNFCFICHCVEKRTKLNKKRQGYSHDFLKKQDSNSDPLSRRHIQKDFVPTSQVVCILNPSILKGKIICQQELSFHCCNETTVGEKRPEIANLKYFRTQSQSFVGWRGRKCYPMCHTFNQSLNAILIVSLNIARSENWILPIALDYSILHLGR